MPLASWFCFCFFALDSALRSDTGEGRLLPSAPNCSSCIVARRGERCSAAGERPADRAAGGLSATCGARLRFGLRVSIGNAALSITTRASSDTLVGSCTASSVALAVARRPARSNGRDSSHTSTDQPTKPWRDTARSSATSSAPPISHHQSGMLLPPFSPPTPSPSSVAPSRLRSRRNRPVSAGSDRDFSPPRTRASSSTRPEIFAASAGLSTSSLVSQPLALSECSTRAMRRIRAWHSALITARLGQGVKEESGGLGETDNMACRVCPRWRAYAAGLTCIAGAQHHQNFVAYTSPAQARPPVVR